MELVVSEVTNCEDLKELSVRRLVQKKCCPETFVGEWRWRQSRVEEKESCMIVQAVIKANSRFNGNGQISILSGSKTTERISMKHGIYNYIVSMTIHANPCGAMTMSLVWANM